MEILFLVVFAFIAIVLISLAKSGKSKKSGLVLDGAYFQKRPLSNVEQIAYWRIVEAVGPEKVVLSQVAFSAFIGAKGGDKRSNFSKWAAARQKVADFVICNKDFSIFAIVEVDDATHSAEKDRLRDAITEEAGIKTYRIEAKALPSVNELRKSIK